MANFLSKIIQYNNITVSNLKKTYTFISKNHILLYIHLIIIKMYTVIYT